MLRSRNWHVVSPKLLPGLLRIHSAAPLSSKPNCRIIGPPAREVTGDRVTARGARSQDRAPRGRVEPSRLRKTFPISRPRPTSGGPASRGFLPRMRRLAPMERSVLPVAACKVRSPNESPLAWPRRLRRAWYRAAHWKIFATTVLSDHAFRAGEAREASPLGRRHFAPNRPRSPGPSPENTPEWRQYSDGGL